MTASARLLLPFLVPGQAQKELFHNEALQQLDVLVQTVVEGSVTDAPPAIPTLGKIYLVGPAPSGAWQAQPNALAAWTSGGWRFVSPFEGLRVAVRQTGQTASFRSGSWLIGIIDVASVRVNGVRVIASQTPAIASVSGGSVLDVQARAALEAILTSLRGHGLIAS